jgi:hypothetical protein
MEEAQTNAPRRETEIRAAMCLRGNCNALRTGMGKTQTMMSVAELNDALNNQNARKSIHFPWLMLVFQL